MIFNRKILYGPVLLISLIVLFLSTYAIPVPQYNPVQLVYSMYTYPILLLCCVILILIKFRESSKLVLDEQFLVLIFAFFFMFISYSIAWEPYRFVSTIILWHLLWIGFFIFFSLLVVDTPEKFTKFVTDFILIFAGLATLAAIVSTVTAIQLGPFEIAKYTSKYPRVASWFINPNKFAPAPAAALLICIHRIKYDFKLRYVALLALFCGITYWTGSRGVILSLAAGLSVYLMMIGGKKLKAVTLLFSILIPILSFAMVLIYSDIFTVFDRGSGPEARLKIWRDGVQLIMNMSIPEIIFGNGHLYFGSVVEHSPHNGYLRFIVNYGLIFLFLYSYYVLNGIKDLIRGHSLPSNQLWVSVLVFLLVRDISDQGILHVRFEGFLFAVVVVYLFVYRVSLYKKPQTNKPVQSTSES